MDNKHDIESERRPYGYITLEGDEREMKRGAGRIERKDDKTRSR